MRIRQLVIAASERDQLASHICEVFDLNVAFHDPGIIYFGLENVLIPIGDTFLEIVTPVKENTTAGRFINRRKGDGGYMVIVDAEDLDQEKKRVESSGIEIVYESQRTEEDVTARTIHLHPKQVGGAIISIDKMKPESAWLWAGLDWKEHVNTSNSNILNGVQLQSENPKEMMSKWEHALGVKGNSDLIIELKDSRIKFNEISDDRGEGITAFEISLKDQDLAIGKAEKLGLVSNKVIKIGGVDFLFN